MADCENVSRSILSNNNDVFSYYVTMNLNNMCRVCLEKGQKLMPIFDSIKPLYSILIMACASVDVSINDGLPPYICHKCIAKLNIAFQFKTLCESSDARLRQCLHNLQSLPVPSEITTLEDVVKVENSHDTKIALCNLHGDIITEYTIQNDGSVQLGSNIQNDYKSNNISSNENFNNIQNIKFQVPESTENKMKFAQYESAEQQLPKNNTKPIKEHQCDTCGKVFSTKPILIHHIRTHTGERPYVCHLCDKTFINGGHLHIHMRTHTGEKNHICAACSKAFATAQQLTKHTIAIHTSERPYACSHCGKRFASSSNLSSHVKIHTGEKNYHCDQCTKAFSTKGQLYQHLLVHTGEKAFICEYCDKRFSQKAHLIRHLKTHNIYI